MGNDVNNKPKLLCRYRHFCANNISALKNGQLFFSTPSFFNDPFDSHVYVDGAKFIASIEHELKEGFESGHFFREALGVAPETPVAKRLYEAYSNEGLRNIFLSDMLCRLKTLQSKIVNNSKIICFSELLTSVLMWSHYAGDNTGFLLVYDTNKIQAATVFDENNNVLPVEKLLDRVTYYNVAPDCGQVFFDEMPRRITQGSGLLKVKADNRFHLQFLYSKQESWSYEKEWRLCPVGEDISRPSRANYLSIDPDVIIFGAKISSENRDKIIQAIEGKDIELMEAYVDDSTPRFCLNVREYKRC